LNPDNLLNAVLRKHGNKYESVKFLGGGGFSNVYLIKDSKTSEEYALKIMDYDRVLQILKNKKPPDINAKLEIMKKRFLNEAAFYKAIDHPNIVKIRTFDVIDDVNGEIEIPYLITQFINGKSLKKTIEDNGPLTFETALKISGNVLSALQTIHQEGFIHRDIKPGNIMIDSETGEAILIDFGLAKDILSETTLTVSSDIIGTPAYMSPEQFRGLKGLDYKTDIYSFGVVLYEMLTGKRPSMEGAGLNPNLPPGIENILAKAMETDPRNRYKDAEEFLNSLKELERRFPTSDKEAIEKAEPLAKPKRKKRKYPIYLFMTLAILIAALAIIILSPSSSENALYKESFTLAKKAFAEDKLYKAEYYLSEAGKIKNTAELNDLFVRIKEKKQLAGMKKDFDSLEDFLKGGSKVKDKIAECSKFLDKYKNIPQNDDTKKIISQVKRNIEQFEGEKPGQYDKHITDAEEYLKNGELKKAYDSVKRAKSLGETQKTGELEEKIFTASVSAAEAYCKEAKLQEAKESLLLAKAIKPGSSLQDLEKRIKFLEPMPMEVSAVYKTIKKIGQNNKNYWEADFGDGIVMVYIPAGNDIPGYWMGKTEVSVGHYMKFVNELRSNEPEWKEKGSRFNVETGNDNYYRNQVDNQFPVVGIFWDNAAAFCRWLSRNTGLNFKLPSEAQWQKAAQGTDGRLYPWGFEKPGDNLNLANFNSSGKTVKVAANPQGASPYGLLNMAGNVEEWCDNQVARGGSFYDNERYITCSSRKKYDPSERNHALGFRLCMVGR
jgi:serine/threonine protein kinase